MAYLILFVTILVIILLYLWLESLNSDYWEKRNIAHMKKRTPFGLAWDFIVSRKSLAEIYKEIFEKFPTEPYIGIFLGSKPVLLLRDPINIQAVIGDFQSFYSRGRHVNKSDVLGNNILFTNEFWKWKILRKNLSPVFSSNKLRSMFCVMEDSAKNFVNFIKTNEELRSNTCNLMHTYTDTLLTTSLFGIKASGDLHSPFRDVARGAVASNLKENMKFVIGNTFPCVSKMLRFTAFGDFQDFFIDTVKNIIRSRENDCIRGNDFIDYTIQLQRQGTMKDTTANKDVDPTDELIAAQAFFFFIAGVDTAASVLHFTLLELSYNRKILSRVHDEIDKVFKKCNDNLTYDDANELKYLEMVIKETLRKYPPVGVIHRSCTKDAVLPVGGIKLKVGDKVIIPIYAVHNDPKNHPEPDKFDPDRFLPENKVEFNKSAYIPFGGGNRACLGSRFGRLQALVGLAWLLRRFTLTPQSCTSKTLDPSSFLVRMTTPRYGLVPRGESNLRI